MDGADWLRTQLTSFGCASCGQAYRSAGIRILAQREELFFVDLGCEACGTRAVAVVTIQPDGDELSTAELDAPGPVGRLTAGPAPTPAPAVTADDVLDMHRYLEDFDGDIRALLGYREREGA